MWWERSQLRGATWGEAWEGGSVVLTYSWRNFGIMNLFDFLLWLGVGYFHTDGFIQTWRWWLGGEEMMASSSYNHALSTSSEAWESWTRLMGAIPSVVKVVRDALLCCRTLSMSEPFPKMKTAMLAVVPSARPWESDWRKFTGGRPVREKRAQRRSHLQATSRIVTPIYSSHIPSWGRWPRRKCFQRCRYRWDHKGAMVRLGGVRRTCLS